jgi:hypothetical protein
VGDAAYLDAFVGGGGINEAGESFGNYQECKGGEGAPLGDPTVDGEEGAISLVDFDPPARGVGRVGEEGGQANEIRPEVKGGEGGMVVGPGPATPVEGFSPVEGED